MRARKPSSPRSPSTLGPWGEVESSSATAYVLAEELVALESSEPPGRRVAPDDVEHALRSEPIAVVLDRLEATMTFHESHRWVLSPNKLLGGQRPVEVVAHGHVQDVLSIIGALPPPTP